MLIFIFCFICFILGVGFLITNNWLSYIGSFLLVLSTSVPDLYYVPHLDDDLYRYFSEMEFVSQFPNIHSLLYSYKYISTFNYHRFSFIYNIFQWAIARTGYFNILPFLSVFITYLCVLIPFIHEKNSSKLQSSFIILSCLLVLSLFPYHSVSSTIRENIAAGIFFLITYLYLINRRKKYKLLILIFYLPLIFIHEAMILPIILVLLAILLPKNFKWYYYLVTVFVFIFMLSVVKFIGISSAANSVLGIAYKYSGVSVLPFLQNGSSKITFGSLILIPYLCSIGNLFLLRSLKEKDRSVELNLYIIFNLSSILLLFWSLIIAQRYIIFVAMIDMFLLFRIKKIHCVNNDISKIIYITATILGISTFIFLGFRGMMFNFSSLLQY